MVGQRLQAVPLLLLSFVLHPIMAALGISFCFFLTIALLDPVHVWLRSLRSSLAAAVPLGWIFESPTPIWRKALQTRRYLFLYRWTWYEWLGALAPLFLFWLLWRIAAKARRNPPGAICAGRLRLRRVSAGRGHGHAGLALPWSAHAAAAHALSPPDLFLHGPALPAVCWANICSKPASGAGPCFSL